MKNFREWCNECDRKYNEYAEKWDNGKIKCFNEITETEISDRDLKRNIDNRASGLIYNALKKEKRSSDLVALFGYNLSDLMRRLKKTMPEGYCWQDYLEGILHVDHIVPKAVFNYYKVGHTDFKRCWALDNLQLLLAKKNRMKSDSLAKPLQLSLAL